MSWSLSLSFFSSNLEKAGGGANFPWGIKYIGLLSSFVILSKKKKKKKESNTFSPPPHACKQAL